MNLGIYKSGQGYWVRMMTAVLLGLVTVSLAAWSYSQALVFAERLHKTTYLIGFETEQPGAFAQGDRVELATRPDSTGATTPVGTAVVGAVDAGEKRLITVTEYKPASTDPRALEPSAAGSIRKAAPDAKPVLLAKSGAVVGVAPINPTILSGAAAAVVVILGAVLGYWFIGLRPRTVEFLIATDFEMKKVNWSTPREIMGHTWVVIGACVLLAAILFMVDIGLKKGFSFINLLPREGQPTTAKANP